MAATTTQIVRKRKRDATSIPSRALAISIPQRSPYQPEEVSDPVAAVLTAASISEQLPFLKVARREAQSSHTVMMFNEVIENGDEDEGAYLFLFALLKSNALQSAMTTRWNHLQLREFLEVAHQCSDIFLCGVGPRGEEVRSAAELPSQTVNHFIHQMRCLYAIL